MVCADLLTGFFAFLAPLALLVFVPPVAVALLAVVPPPAAAANDGKTRVRKRAEGVSRGDEIKWRVTGREEREMKVRTETQEDQWVGNIKGEMKWRCDKREENDRVVPVAISRDVW